MLLAINTLEIASQSPAGRSTAEVAPTVEAEPAPKAPSGSTGSAGGDRNEPSSKLQSQPKSKETLRRVTPTSGKSEAPLPAIAPSPATPSAAPAKLEKDAGPSDAAKSQSSLKKAELKLDGTSKELRKSADAGSVAVAPEAHRPGAAANPRMLTSPTPSPMNAHRWAAVEGRIRRPCPRQRDRFPRCGQQVHQSPGS